MFETHPKHGGSRRRLSDWLEARLQRLFAKFRDISLQRQLFPATALVGNVDIGRRKTNLWKLSECQK